MGRLPAGLLGVCLLLFAAAAAAQDRAADQQAREAFQQGAVAYGEGRFDAALEQFERAYELSRRPALLYNIGVAAQRALRTERALDAFENYLRALPEADNRAAVEVRIASLRRQSSREPEEVAEPQEPAPDGVASTDEGPAAEEPMPRTAVSPPEPEGPGALPWITLGASAVVAVGGGVLFLIGRSDIDTVEEVERGSGTTWSDVSDAEARAPVLTGIGMAAMAVGIVGAGVGAYLLAAGGGDATEVQVAVGPSGVSLAGRF